MDYQILSTRLGRNRYVSVDAVTVTGRRLGATVIWPESTLEGIVRALDRAYALALEADTDRAGALASIAADLSDPPV